VTASTDDLLALPHPPSTTPPAGTVGLLEPAAAAGPRFRLGSLVWAAAPADDGPPAKGTVGQLVGADKGQGGQALYKVWAAAGAGRQAGVGRGLPHCTLTQQRV
jgi:hypothetical protein